MENENLDASTITEDGINAAVDAQNDPETLKALLSLAQEERDRERDAKNAILARAKAAEARLKEGKSGVKEINTGSNLSDEALEMRLDGYTKDEVQFVLRNGGRKVLEDKNSFVAIALQQRREQRQAEQAAAQVTQSSSQLSEVERRYTPEQMKNMTAKELEAILPKA